MLLQYLAGQRVHWDDILENDGADDPVSMISLSFPARLRMGGEGAIGSAAEAPDTARERRALRVWRQQLHALIEATSASPHTDVEWQVYLLQWTTLRGQKARHAGRLIPSESLRGSAILNPFVTDSAHGPGSRPLDYA